MPETTTPAVVWSASACLARYEALRRQALESTGGASEDRLEMALLERQGMAAWIIAGPMSLSSVVVPVEVPMPKLREAQSPPHALVLALVDLVMGDRQEE